jgi:hypothetical protein
VSSDGEYDVAWSCDEEARTCVAEVSGPQRTAFSLRLPYGATLVIADRRFPVPPEASGGSGAPAVRKQLPKILFDVGVEDVRRIERFYSAWRRGKRETPDMMAALDDYAGGRGKRHNLDLILASWIEASRRAELQCVPLRDAGLKELRARYSLRQMLSLRHRPNAYWEARKAVYERDRACKQVEHIMGVADGRVLVWLAQSVEQWPKGQPKPWEIVRRQIELVGEAEEITREHGGDERGEKRHLRDWPAT